MTAEGYDGDGSVVVRRLLHHPILEHPFNRAEWTPGVVKATLTLTPRLVLSSARYGLDIPRISAFYGIVISMFSTITIRPISTRPMANTRPVS